VDHSSANRRCQWYPRHSLVAAEDRVCLCQNEEVKRWKHQVHVSGGVESRFFILPNQIVKVPYENQRKCEDDVQKRAQENLSVLVQVAQFVLLVTVCL